MKKKYTRVIDQVITYSPLAGIIFASFLHLTKFQNQLLMLFLLVWANAFFLYKSWASQ
ncbi:MAG: hypothetical protein ACOY0R_18445 [Chloroflexota bacterium]